MCVERNLYSKRTVISTFFLPISKSVFAIFYVCPFFYGHQNIFFDFFRIFACAFISLRTSEYALTISLRPSESVFAILHALLQVRLRNSFVRLYFLRTFESEFTFVCTSQCTFYLISKVRLRSFTFIQVYVYEIFYVDPKLYLRNPFRTSECLQNTFTYIRMFTKSFTSAQLCNCMWICMNEFTSGFCVWVGMLTVLLFPRTYICIKDFFYMGFCVSVYLCKSQDVQDCIWSL